MLLQRVVHVGVTVVVRLQCQQSLYRLRQLLTTALFLVSYPAGYRRT